MPVNIDLHPYKACDSDSYEVLGHRSISLKKKSIEFLQEYCSFLCR